jgi:hypothetical protein
MTDTIRLPSLVHNYSLKSSAIPATSGETQGVVKENLRVFQLNLQHSRVTSYELYKKLKCDSLALIQEPWVHKDKIMGLPSHFSVVGQQEQPRAAIVYDPAMEMLLQFTSPDLASAIWVTDSPNPVLHKILVVSWY